jgi:hypothetical protein
MDYFVKPLRNNPAKYHVTNDFINATFSDIETIYKVNYAFLDQLEDIIPNISKDNNSLHSLADITMTWSHAFKLYVPYISKYSSISRTLVSTLEKNDKLNEFVNSQVQVMKFEQEIGQIHALMITPIQRIPRYRLLLENLVEVVTENLLSDRDEVAKLNKALESIREVATYCNQKEHEFEQIAKIIEISEELKNKAIIHPSRKLVLKCNNIQFEQKSGKMGRCNLYLFNDLIIVQRKNSMKKPIEIVIDCELRIAEGESETEVVICRKDDFQENGLKGHLIKLQTCTAQERKQIVDEISNLLMKIEEKQRNKM